MNTYTITKAMISSAVERGMKEMEDDPKRSVRRLADLGSQFSKNEFQKHIFSIMQELLANENSAYYDMMAGLLRNTDHEAMKIFGVNCGYMSWSYGAKVIRSYEEKKGYAIPWVIMFRYDPSRENGLTIPQIASLIEQGKSLGIYSYYIRQEAVPGENYAILDLFEKNPDCAFLWMRSTGRLTAAQVEFLKNCKNTAVILPIGDEESLLTAGLLRDQKVIYAMYDMYSDSEQDAACKERRFQSEMETVLTAEAPLFVLIAEDGTSHRTQQQTLEWCYNSRLEQNYPVMITEYYSDAASISRHVVGHAHLLEIDTDGKILRPAAAAGIPFPFSQKLPDTLAQIMPQMQ